MDKSKEYILQCEKAVKIQYSHIEYEEGDWFYSKLDGTINIVNDKGIYSIRGRMWNFMDDVWMPTQSQLQGMLDINTPLGLIAFAERNIWKQNEKMESCITTFDYYKKFTSMEQLWMAFVMKDFCSKQWSSEKQDWEEIK